MNLPMSKEFLTQLTMNDIRDLLKGMPWQNLAVVGMTFATIYALSNCDISITYKDIGFSINKH